MTTFEVTIEEPDSATVSIKILVEADGWVGAWRQSLRVIEGDVPDDTVCTLLQDHTIDVRSESSTQRCHIRQLRLTPGRSIEGPRLPVGVPVPLGPLLDQENRGDRAPKPRHRLDLPSVEGKRPAPRGHVRDVRAGGRPTGHAAALAKPSAANIPSVSGVDTQPVPQPRQPTDPMVRVLGQLERARLAARPVVIDPRTGLPRLKRTTRDEGPSQAARASPRAAPTRIGSAAAPRQLASQKTTRHATRRLAALTSMDTLPQQFRAVGDASIKHASADEATAKTIDTAWQHIDCGMAQVLRLSGDALQVVAARGQRQRELLTCRVLLKDTLGQLSATQAARVRFGDHAVIRYLPLEAEPFEIRVRSALSVPVNIGDERYGVLLLLNAGREAGFGDDELRAMSYLGQTLGKTLTKLRSKQARAGRLKGNTR